jgi:hypothetical protein
MRVPSVPRGTRFRLQPRQLPGRIPGLDGLIARGEAGHASRSAPARRAADSTALGVNRDYLLVGSCAVPPGWAGQQADHEDVLAGEVGRDAVGEPVRCPLGTAFEALVRYGKERGELDAELDEEETVTLLALVTADAIVRWGSGNRSASWLQEALRNRVEVILSGMTHAGR